MTTASTTARYLGLHPRLSAGLYLTLVAAFCLTVLFILIDIVELHLARNDALDLLNRLRERAKLSATGPGTPLKAWPAGSPFLQGQTATVASASLVQHVASAITQAGGTVISTEVEPQRPQSKDVLKVLATCDIAQSSLQQLLYTVESGMPFLFVEQLSVQTSSNTPASAANENGLLRVSIGVSGRWSGASP